MKKLGVVAGMCLLFFIDRLLQFIPAKKCVELCVGVVV